MRYTVAGNHTLLHRDASQAALQVAQSTNVVAGGITYDDGGVRSAVTDAALFSQVSSDWNKLAGIDTGN